MHTPLATDDATDERELLTEVLDELATTADETLDVEVSLHAPKSSQ